MIFVRDKGRMCNNILQFAHVYAWAREHRRSALSMRFAYKYPFFHICNTPHHNILFYLMGKYAAKLNLIPTVSFHDENVDVEGKANEIIAHKHVLVEGWYVRFYDLFLKYKPEILQLFAFHKEIEQKIGSMISSNEDQINLGLHIRRGDYARWQGGKYLFSDEQYIRIVQQFIHLFPHKKISLWICGNDPQLCQEAYRNAFGTENVHFPNGNPGEDLCLLSHCDYLIGAPSTFTLVASMYHDVPLYWIKDCEKTIGTQDFELFDQLFKKII